MRNLYRDLESCKDRYPADRGFLSVAHADHLPFVDQHRSILSRRFTHHVQYHQRLLSTGTAKCITLADACDHSVCCHDVLGSLDVHELLLVGRLHEQHRAVLCSDQRNYIFHPCDSQHTLASLYCALLATSLDDSMSLFAIDLFDNPIYKGFGLVAILSGIDKASLYTLKAAALSGELNRPVSLNVAVIRDIGGDKSRGRIRYSIGHERREKDRLRRGVKYE